MTTCFREPTLAELINDPLTHAVMRRITLTKHLRTYCAIWCADALIPWPTPRPASGSTSIDHLPISSLFEPAKRRRKESHEHEQYISRGVSRQQDEPANDSMECPSRSGTACEATRGDSGLEGVGRKTSSRNRRHGRTARQDQKRLPTRHRRYKQ